jgi:hypothetical protein
VIFDNTIAEKTKLFQSTGFHQSHLKGKQVWGRYPAAK